MANIIANEEIIEAEQEKTSLLLFSNELAAARDGHSLQTVVTKGLKNLLQISEYLLSVRTNDQNTHTVFLHDNDAPYANDSRFELITNKNIPIEEDLLQVVFNSEIPIRFSVDELLVPGKLKMESAGFWKSVGVKSITSISLRVGNEVIGALWTFNNKDENQRLMSGISSLIAVALSNTLASETIQSQFNQISSYQQQLEIENQYLQEEIQITHNYSEIVGECTPMTKVFEMVSQVAATESTVLILGETGTGKELIARALHNSSQRKNKVMVKINCATLPPNLIESELFGHERGAFTGAIDRRIGKFELANNSSLFLDEIGELPLDLQVKLLRALQEREIERVGGRTVIHVNVRIIAATNRDLYKEVQAGNFRSDLFFRLNVFPIKLPPLRERKEDIASLASHFLMKYAKNSTRGKMSFSNKALKQLVTYSWPGNVRELEHLIERSILLAESPIIQQVHLPFSENGESTHLLQQNAIKTIDEIEREHIMFVLKKTNGKVAGQGGAASLLKIPSTTLNSKIKRLKIKKGLAGI
ncbi:sigma 54-interacting transcriptional regulator [Mucilaginibacter rigui]|uniref:Sigma 54-interacting transcriptional regulator n=1 Tax=Mucilaginibacter rigui TaxID=534635 RepID=A0ABR7X5T1_9SPHI|nr:sigma 54-interacting transcriptional regulator [Mucilaginibacter rigui]